MENTYAEKEPLIKVNNLEIQYTSGKEVVCAVNNLSLIHIQMCIRDRLYSDQRGKPGDSGWIEYGYGEDSGFQSELRRKAV